MSDERMAALELALSEGLDLCERARRMEAMDKDRLEYLMRNPEVTKSATIPLWAEEQYQRDLAEWEKRARAILYAGGRIP